MPINAILSRIARARLAESAHLLATAAHLIKHALHRILTGDTSADGDSVRLGSGGMVLSASAAVAPRAIADRQSDRAVIAVLVNALFIAFALAFAAATTAFGCSGSVSSGGGTTPPDDPNRALGTYRISSTFNDSESRIFFGYWFSGQNGISAPAAQAFKEAMVPIENTARVTIVPSSVLYEETAVSIATGQIVTVSVSGTWNYESQTSIQVDWGSAFVTASTFPTTPPFDVATVGTLLEGPMPDDIVFAGNATWIELASVQPGPLDGAFIREAN